MIPLQDKIKLIKHYDYLGWKVIPLRKGQKTPFWKNWSDPEKWKSGEYSNEKTIEALKKDPNLNVGVLTGKLSNIIAIDVDQPKLARYDPKPAIEMGALAHSTSKGARLIFHSSNPEVLNFSRKVTKKREDVDENLLVGNVEDKQEITIVEVLGTGRQFVLPPSIHPSGAQYEWITPLPKDASEILEIKDLKHLKAVLMKVFKNKAIIFDLFTDAEMQEKAREQRKEVSESTLTTWLRTILKHLDKHIVKETRDYILLHCPLHPPDDNPSFVIYKNTYLAVDFHDGKVYKLKDLAQALGIQLPTKKKRRASNVAWIPLDPPTEGEDEGVNESEEEDKGEEGKETKDEEGEVPEGEDKKEPALGWLKVEKVDSKKYLVSVVKGKKVIVPARQVGPDFAFKPSLIKYFFGHIKKQIGTEKFNEWFGELQERIRKKITFLDLNLPSTEDKGEDRIPVEEFDLEVLRKFGLTSLQEVEETFRQLILESLQNHSLHSSIAEFLMERFTFKTLEDSEEVLYYENGVYKFNGEQKIKELVQKLLTAFAVPQLAKRNLIDEVIEYIKRSTYINIKEFYKFDESGLINLKNGVLDPETLELYPHSPDYLFLWQLPVKYDPLAKAKKIEKFLREIVAPEDVETLLRVAAYPLMPGQPFQVAIFLVGSGANGKSTFLNLLKALYGHENVSALSIHDLENNRFAPASLIGKLANICADIPSNPLDKIETFKAITGGDSIQVEKKFKQSYPVPYLRAKLIFSANKLPELSEYNYASLRRFIIIRFPYKFEGARKNPNLLKELTTESELSGFLNIILNAYIRLKREGFATKSVEETQKDWVRWSSPLRAFVMEHIEPGEDQVAKDDVWEAFYAYCKRHNIPFPFVGEGSKKSFFKQFRRILREMDMEVGESRPTTEDGKRIRVFTGIKLVGLDKILEEAEEGGQEEDVEWQVLDEIVNILSMQEVSFDELKQMTTFTDIVLAKALKKLQDEGIIWPKDGKYRLINRSKAAEMGFNIVEEIRG